MTSSMTGTTTSATSNSATSNSAAFEHALEDALAEAFATYARAHRRRLVGTIFKGFRRPYVEFLRSMNHHAAHVSAILERATQSLEGREDAHAFFVKHTKEEAGHDRIARADLGALGESLDWEPSSSYRALASYTSHLAEAQPLGLLGFLVAAEGFAAKHGPRVIRLLRALRYRPTTTRFIRLHADVDQAHFAVLKDACARLPKTPEEENAILDAIHVTAHLMASA
jgi:hypothetical protein